MTAFLTCAAYYIKSRGFMPKGNARALTLRHARTKWEHQAACLFPPSNAYSRQLISLSSGVHVKVLGKRPREAAHNSLPCGSKFPSTGLKNPPAKGKKMYSRTCKNSPLPRRIPCHPCPSFGPVPAVCPALSRGQTPSDLSCLLAAAQRQRRIPICQTEWPTTACFSLSRDQQA